MRNKIKGALNIPKTNVISSLFLAIFFGLSTVVISTALYSKISCSTNHGFLIPLLDNFTFFIGLFIPAIPCIFFIKELIHRLQINSFLNKILISHDGVHTKQKGELIYDWKDVEEIDGYHDRGRGD